jgi:hypothetical protein
MFKVDDILAEYEDSYTVAGAYGDYEKPGFDMQSDLELVQLAKEWLAMDGYADGLVGIDNTAKLVWLCEAVNWAAKVIRPEYYLLKPRIIDAVAKLPGVQCGWGYDAYDNGVFYLYHVEAGVASFHDPDRQLFSSGEWPYEWSGVLRQEHALDVWVGNVDLAKDLARRSQPGMMEY